MNQADTSKEALRSRLTELSAMYSQAEIARRTQTRRNNVSRYMKGTRIPLQFGAALVGGLGINPAWLLTGEGTPRLDDVSSETARTAENLLELVQAMNSVARMRMGSLVGKHHLRVLRELSDALARYEKLRVQLNGQAGPLYRDLLDRYEERLSKRDVERAVELRKALHQVQRLCDDKDLDYRFTQLQAFQEHFFGSKEAALTLQRGVFQCTMANLGTASEGACDEAFNFAQALRDSGRWREARAVCRAMKVLAEERGLGGPTLILFDALHGLLDVGLGELARGMPLILQAHALAGKEHRIVMAAGVIYALLISGSISLAQALAMKVEPMAVASVMVAFAAWREDAELLEQAIKRHIGPGLPISESSFDARYAKALLAVLQRQRKERWLPFLRELARDGEDARGTFSRRSMAAQLLRRSGETRAAKTQFEAARVCLSKLPPDIQPELLRLAHHQRNALALGDAAAQDEARRFFSDYSRRGYGGLAAQ